MATYAPVLLSGSTDGKPIKVTGTGTGSTVTIHTSVSGSGSWDEVYLWAYNTDTAERTITLEIGGTTDPDNLFPKAYTLPIKQWAQIRFGERTNNACTIKAFASAANVVLIDGNVNRIT